MGQQVRGLQMPSSVRPMVRDIAWAAGFVEGEGNIHSTGQLAVTQVQREPLERLFRFFGGSISGPLTKKGRYYGHKSQPFYRWQATGARGRGIILTLFAFLSPIRKAQVVYALSAEAFRKKVESQQRYRERHPERVAAARQLYNRTRRRRP